MIRKVLLILSLMLFLNSCKIKEIEIGRFQNYRLTNIDQNKAQIEFSVPVKNNNSFGFTIADMRLNLYINDKEIGIMKKRNHIFIPAKSDKMYPVLFEIELDKALGGISR